ncbi:MAG: hypothetical protein KC910_24510 [Candidatus Eremiobacteraeota bacterium]|nr:hypothetical protein [Candidatus Eremiobacteraeota bacterium]
MIIQNQLSSARPATHSAARKKTENQEPPAPPADEVSISYLPQNPDLLGVKHAKVKAGELGDGPSGKRLKVTVPRNFPEAKASDKGNFLFRPDDPRFDSVNTYYVASQTLAMAENYAGRSLPWSFTEELGREQMLVHPHAGLDTANAFYSAEGGSINFFSYTGANNEVHRTGLQSDVVSHETGHAILDALKPMYINSLAVPAGGFHESFGDMMAMLRALHEDSVVAALKSETSGDLSGSNIVSRLAEQLGFDAYGTPALRDAINDHKFADQHFLPYYNPKDGGAFGTEAHAYANLFTGAFYDVFEGLYDLQNQDPNKSFTEAVGSARDQAGKLLLRAIEFSPVGNPAYPEVALAFLQADEIDNGGKFRPLLEQIFKNRKILTDEDIQGLDARSLPNISLHGDVMTEKGADKFLASKRDKLGLPKDVDFSFAQAYKTEKGETFLVWETHRDALLDDPDFGMQEGSKFRGVGGLSLAFDADGKLMACNYDEVSEREMNDIRDHLRTTMAAGALATDVNDHDHSKLHVQVIQDGGPVLQKAPVVYC